MLKYILLCIYYMKNQRTWVKISKYMFVIVEDTIWASVCRITQFKVTLPKAEKIESSTQYIFLSFKYVY